MLHLTVTLNQTTITINPCPEMDHFSDGKPGRLTDGVSWHPWNIRSMITYTHRPSKAKTLQPLSGGKILC